MAKAQRKKDVSAPETENQEVLEPVGAGDGTPEGVTVTEVETPETLGEVVTLAGEDVGNALEVVLESSASNGQVDSTELVDAESSGEDTDEKSEVAENPEVLTLEELAAAGIVAPEDIREVDGKLVTEVIEVVLHEEKPVNEQTVTPPTATAPVALLQDAPAHKYANRTAKTNEAKASHTPGWQYANNVFVISSHKPMRENSVMGKIYNVISQRKDGITGSELVAICRDPSQVRFDNVNSKYCKGGIPVAAWVEDYIVGGMRVRYSHWKIKS